MSDPIYQRYINRIDHNKEYCDHVVMDEKYYASDINSMKSKTQMVKYCAGQVQAALASDGVEDIDSI